ncbi:MAG: hypothetical protein ACTSXO_02260 [Candidatus Heimdallarchaeota archaeon]|nr:MAG: hypothetical protein DRO63_01145 [Candidatus Gerdarchaeota archaeon]RLI71127.1 MAG: hypothetical protein DRP02_05760 [Candidatus Gerdarchaeota archaeon]
MSKKSKEKSSSKSIITVQAMCDVCKKVDAFQIPVKELLPHIGGLYQVSTIHHCKDNKEMVMNIILDRNFTVRQATVSPFVAEREVGQWTPEKVDDIKFLVKQIKGADQLIEAVLSYKTVIVAGTNKTFVKRVVRTLELFSPSRYPQTEEWTDKLITDKKIIGTLPTLASNYKKAVIVDLEKKKILNGKQSLYCQQFLESLVTLEPEGMAYAAQMKIGMLVDFAKMLIELSKEPKIGTRALELVEMDVSPDALELIKEMVKGFDPTALKIIKEDWL